jgi:hypothetical protein
MNKEFDKKTVFIVGRSKLPQGGVTAKNVYDQIALAVLIELEYGVIVKLESTLITDMANETLADLILGCSLLHGTQEIEHRIKNYYFGGAKNSIIAAVKDLHRKFEELRNKNID